MMNDSIKLAQMWTGLKAVKDRLDNEIIPIAGYLGIEDPELMTTLEEFSAKIEIHLDKYRLVVVTAIKQ